MKKIMLIGAITAFAGLAFTVSLHAQTPTPTPTPTPPAISVVTVTPPTPPPVIIHRVQVPSSISVTLAPTLLAQLDAQAPAGKVVSRMLIIGNADGSFTATITYGNPPTH